MRDLVGGFKHGFYEFHFIKKGCHLNPIDFHSIIFQDCFFNHQPDSTYVVVNKWEVNLVHFQVMGS